MQLKTKWLDFTSIGLSVVCMAHCLLLPFAAALLPALELFLPHDVAHRLLILMAAPLSLWTLHRTNSWTQWEVSLPMVFGLLLLALAAFVPALLPYDAPLSVAGALFVAAGHLVRYLSARPAHGHVHSVECEGLH